MAEGQHAAKPKNSSIRIVASVAIMFALVIGMALLLRTFVFEAFRVPSASMESTIMTGDLVFTEKISIKTSSVQQGDIVVFDDPASTPDNPRTLIKRVMAVAGDVIDISGGEFYVNGVVQIEPYTGGKRTYVTNSSTIQYPYTIPDGYIWVMGDNRSNSQDSRYYGPVSLDAVQAKAVLIYWPLDHFKFLN